MSGEPEVQVGDRFRARGVQGAGITFTVERLLPGHVFGALTVMGRDAEKGAFRWARFHQMFEPIEDAERTRQGEGKDSAGGGSRIEPHHGAEFPHGRPAPHEDAESSARSTSGTGTNVGSSRPIRLPGSTPKPGSLGARERPSDG